MLCEESNLRQPTTSSSFQQIDSMDALREFVNSVICEHGELEEGTFPMTEQVLRRGGEPCGIRFCLHGPRATLFTAIWETDENQVLFYGSSGKRFQKIRLTRAGS